MPHRRLAAALASLAVLAVPGLAAAQSMDFARADMTGSTSVAAPARSSSDQLRSEIWAANAARKAEFAGQMAAHKAAVAAYEAEVARVAAETARIRQEDAARQQAYASEKAAYEAKLAACHANGARGCRWPSPPPRRIY